jgi:preprotein translocase subunit SecG
MEQEQEKIILENSYPELSVSDKKLLSDLVSSEEEFDVLKQILSTAPTLNEDVAPSPKLKASLMETFAKQHEGVGIVASAEGSKKTKIILFRSVAAVAAIFILFMLLFPMGSDKKENNFTAENNIKKEEVKNEKVESKIEKEQTEDKETRENREPESILPIQESPVQVAVNNATRASIIGESTSVSADEFSNQPTFVDLSHSDRLESYDLPLQSRQVVQDNPALLDILYTAF